MIKATSVRRGMVIKHEGVLYMVTGIEHITPGKGNAVMQVGVKELERGKSMTIRFRSAADVETIHFEAVPHQYLYSDGTGYHFMNLEDFNTVILNEDFVGDYKNFLIENLELGLAFHEGKPIYINFPKAINLKITYAEPWVKGDSVSNNTKPVTLETGYVVKVPMFINEGDLVRIDTETGKYIERVNG